MQQRIATLGSPMEKEGSCGWDFLEWVGPDVSACIFRRLDDPADLVRAATVSRSWLGFILEKVGMSLCLQICPERANLTNAEEEVSRSPPTAHGAGSSHGVEFEIREREYRTYSYVGGALVLTTKPSVDCILRCIGASSTDNFPDESIENTLVPQDRVKLPQSIGANVYPDNPLAFRPSYWSSGGHDDPDTTESLTYRLISDMCLIDEIRLRPFEAFFQLGHPIYSSKSVRFRLGHSKIPHGSESFVTDDNENLMAIANKNYVWTYTSPEFPMLQENVLQSFKFPRPVLCGGVVKVELLGGVQKQTQDDRYYVCICHAQVIGRSLWPVFMLDICDPAGYSVFKYLPGAKDLYGEDAICQRIAGFMDEDDVGGMLDNDPFV